MKKLLSILLVISVAGFATSCSDDSSDDKIDTNPQNNTNVSLVMATGSETGTYYSFGTAIANHATANAGFRLTANVGKGSQNNIERLASTSPNDKVDLAFAQSDVANYAYRGTRLFEGKSITSFRVVAALYTEPIQIVARKDANIKSVSDLKGKKVSIGETGSGVYFNAIDVLNAYDIKVTDFTAQNKSFTDSAAGLTDGSIQAAFIVAGAPTEAITNLRSNNLNIDLLSLDNTHINSLLSSNPYYSEYTIQSNVYSGIGATNTVGADAILLADKDVPEDIIYALCKDLFENAESQKNVHPKYEDINLKKAISVRNLPYHAGAAKYYKEKGKSVYTK